MENRSLVFWISAFFVLFLDRISKLLVLNFIDVNSSISFGFFSFTHVRNTGTAFGLFKDASWFFVLFAIAVSFFLILRHKYFAKNLQFILGLVLGGAVGNLIDRLYYGSVIDFIDFHIWPSFNVADSAISIAVVLLLLREYWPKKRNI